MSDDETLAERRERAEALARRFHEVYERLAPSFGYETRLTSRVFDPHTANGRLMIAVCAELLVPPDADDAHNYFVGPEPPSDHQGDLGSAEALAHAHALRAKQ